MTNANAQVLWWRDRTPFGQTVAEGGFSQNPLRFPGQFADAESGLAYNYFRDYDPALGRYIQSDPIGLGGGLNTYAYVMGNPLRYTDPTGQFIPFVPIVVGIAERYGAEIIIGAAISAGIEYYCTGTVTAQGVLIGAILGPVGRVVGGRAWALASRYVPGVRWVGAAVGRGAGAIGGAVSAALGRLGGSIAAKGLGVQNSLYKAAVQQFKNTRLSNAGRALTKHPEVIGATKATLRQTLPSDSAINSAARAALRNILRNGATTSPMLGRYGAVTQVQIPGGFGARWKADGSWIGFINP